MRPSLVSAPLVAALLVTGAGCLHRPPPVRLLTPTPIAVGLLLDRDLNLKTTALEVPPDEVREQLAATLAARNLTARDPGAEGAQLAPARDTPQRLARLSQSSPGANLVLLGELKVVFYELLQGRYKWTVYARFTVARAGEPASSSSADVEVPVFLLYDHEREAAALRAAAPALAERAGALVDAFVTGRPGFPQVQAAAEPSPKGRAARAGQGVTVRAGQGPVYFVLVDRFANGDKSNDAGIDAKDPQAFHGGDLQGVLDRLDDLQALGVQTLWLSPVFQMRRAKFFGHGAFHGYWVENFAQIEPGFGDVALLRKLSDALHARGMALVLDVVLNHVAMDSKLTREHPEWFHGKGEIKDWNDAGQLETHDVHGLPDLAQEREDVYRYLLQTSLKWIDEVRPDGFRLDAVKHVPLSFWARYNRAVHEHAGKDFWLLGEALDGEPRKLAGLLREGGFDALFDFPLKFALTDVVCKGKHPGRIAATLQQDTLYGGAAQKLVTLLDNHDLPRVFSECGNDLERTAQALALLFTARGTPSLLYGTEVPLAGAKEPENRADMRFFATPLRERITRLTRLRREHPSFSEGTREVIALDDGLLAEARTGAGELAYVLYNGGEKARDVASLHLAEGARDALTGEDLPATLPPHSLTLAIAPLAASRLPVAAPRAPCAVAFRIRNAPLRDGDSLRLVGAGPLLGDWNPAQALEVRDGAVQARFTPGAVLEFKFVVRRRDGSLSWEAGEDRFLLVPKAGPMTYDATWQAS